MTTEQNWAEKYTELQKQPPEVGAILKPFGEYAKVEIELESGKEPFVFGRAYVPSIVGHELGWYLHDFDSPESYGLKCILMPQSRDELVRRLGLSEQYVQVKSLKVIKIPQSRKSLLCEVHEF